MVSYQPFGGTSILPKDLDLAVPRDMGHRHRHPRSGASAEPRRLVRGRRSIFRRHPNPQQFHGVGCYPCAISWVSPHHVLFGAWMGRAISLNSMSCDSRCFGTLQSSSQQPTSCDSLPGASRRLALPRRGEPLENYEAVSSAVKGFVDPMRFGLAPSSLCLGGESEPKRKHLLGLGVLFGDPG